MKIFIKHPLIKFTLLGGAFLFTIISCASSSRHNYKSAPYQTGSSDGKFEIRNYPALPVVETNNDTDDSSFMRLFRYIGGANEKKEKISMTTPVLMQDGKMQFVLPEDKKGNPPRPSTDKVKLATVPARRVAVYQFNGGRSRQSEAAALQKLKTWLAQQKVAYVDKPTFAYYDGPFTLPAMRRNEVMLPLKH
jgi:hypothetical protein